MPFPELPPDNLLPVHALLEVPLSSDRHHFGDTAVVTLVHPATTGPDEDLATALARLLFVCERRIGHVDSVPDNRPVDLPPS